jgi:hypothetical protein
MNQLRKHASTTKTTTNKTKTTKNDFGGIMGKSKLVAKCAPSCSAVQFCGHDKPWIGMPGALVELQFVSFKTKSQ